MKKLLTTLVLIVLLCGNGWASFKPPVEIGKMYKFVATTSLGKNVVTFSCQVLEISENYIKARREKKGVAEVIFINPDNILYISEY